MLYRRFISIKASIALVMLLMVIFSIMRAIGLFGPGSLRWLLPLGFCIMAILPWVMLTPDGRRDIGIARASSPIAYLHASVASVVASLMCFLLGYLLFGETIDNWYVNIGNSYKQVMDTSGMSFWLLSLIFTLPAIIFSPIGEEIFFRGQLQKTLEQVCNAKTSTMIECLLFALVHQLHHGIIQTATGFTYLPIPAALWFAQMFLVAWMFAWLRARTGSIFPAIVAHMVFNLTMNSVIFLFLW